MWRGTRIWAKVTKGVVKRKISEAGRLRKVGERKGGINGGGVERGK